MLCADTKILAKVLALRLEVATPLLVHPDQTGFVKGRNIHDNVILVRSIINYCNKHNIAGVMLSLDEEKAFDRLLWDFRDRALVKLGFSKVFNLQGGLNAWVKDNMPLAKTTGGKSSSK